MDTKIVNAVREIYQTNEFIPLHAPIFSGNESKYVNDTLESTFVSSVGKYVDDLEDLIADYTNAPKAVAIVNGTAALHVALYQADVTVGDFVITQPLTFVATCNAIHQLGAKPIFLDIDSESLGLCPHAVENWLNEYAIVDGEGHCRHQPSGARIRAMVPMHTFGHPAKMDELLQVARKWNLYLIEDAAESLGSFYKGRHTGTLGDIGVLSFNGNKIVTTGGGGMLLCNSLDQGAKLKHITTTAKQPHPYEFFHDLPGFNYRMPNINAALGCAQMEKLDVILRSKRMIAQYYESFFEGSDFRFLKEPGYGHSNYWLNAIFCPSKDVRNKLLEFTNASGIMTRPVWKLMHRLPMYQESLRGDLPNAEHAESLLLNLPSSALKKDLL